MSVEQNKITVRRVIDEVFNKGNMSVIPELIAPGYVYKSPMGIEYRAPDGFKQFVSDFRTAFPDIDMTIDDMFGESDSLAARFSARGTLKGKMGNIPPTGREVKMTFAIFYRFENAKEVEAIEFTDQLALSQQLGVMPPTGQDVQKEMEGYLAAWNAHDVNKILSFFTDDAVYEDVPLGIISRGKKEITTFISNAFVDFPDFKIEVKAAGEWVMSGTFAHSSMPPMPATGKTFSVRGASITEFRNGKISRNSDYYNAVDFMKQVGLMPKQP